MPLISIIIPVYNTGAFLERCLLSIVKQSFSDFEAICIDDGSTDDSIKIVKSFARKDPRIKQIIHEKNLGAGGARNTGIKAAKSNYIAFVDSDDYIDKDMLREIYAATKGEKFDVIKFGYRSIDGAGNFVKSAVPRGREITDSNLFTGRLLITEPHPWNKMWRRNLFTDHNIWFPEKAYWEDFATVPRLLFKAKNIAVIEKSFYSYYDRQDSTVNRITDQHIMDFFRTLDIIKDFLIAEDIYDKEKNDFDSILKIALGWYADRLYHSKAISPKLAADSIRYCTLLAGSYISADDELRENGPEENVKVISRFVRPQQAMIVSTNEAAKAATPASGLWTRIKQRMS